MSAKCTPYVISNGGAAFIDLVAVFHKGMVERTLSKNIRKSGRGSSTCRQAVSWLSSTFHYCSLQKVELLQCCPRDAC